MTPARYACPLFFVLSLMIIGCHHTPPPLNSPGSVPAAKCLIAFEDETARSGIDFRLGHGGRTPLSIVDTIGHGVALIDCDGDGLLDIVFTGPDQVRLYKNLGNWKFKDITATSGLRQKGYWQGIAVGDVDNDGRPDLYIAAKGDAALYRNLGGGRFQEVTAGSGLSVKDPNRWNSAVTFLDYDHDGRLDLYVGAYLDIGSDPGVCQEQGVSMACEPVRYSPQRGVLYHNLGGWRFASVDLSKLVHGKNLGAIAGDLYGDGGTELYLANDAIQCDMLHYLGKGRWREEGLNSGTGVGVDGAGQSGMGVAVGDYDGDGRLDIFVTTFRQEARSLYHNAGSGLYDNIPYASGISKVCLPYVAFGTQFVDLDNDGWPDIAIANGHVQDLIQRIQPTAGYAEPSQILRNLGNGVFSDVSAGAGSAITHPIVGRALCAGDLDNDGKMDLVIEDLEGAPLLLRNTSPSAGNWLRIRLTGTRSNRDGQGAVVTCVNGNRKQVKLATTGGSYYSAGDPRVHFGIGTATQVDSLSIRWPGGKHQVIRVPRINCEIKVTEP